MNAVLLVALCLVGFLLARELVCWYLKTSPVVALLTEIRNELVWARQAREATNTAPPALTHAPNTLAAPAPAQGGLKRFLDKLDGK